MIRRERFLGFLVLACAVVTLPACSESASDDDGIGDESALTASSLLGSVPIGTELVTTTGLNFRRGPGTENAIIRALAKSTSVFTVNRTTPVGAFYNVRVGTQEGWVHGAYLARKSGANAGGPSVGSPPVAGAAAVPAAAGAQSQDGCVQRGLRFSADALPSLPADGAAFVWGGNATDGEQFLDPPYSPDFIRTARAAHDRHLEVFAYLEGPCGDTNGVDDGERARCANIHNAYNAKFAPGTPNTAAARWKPFTMKQLTTSGTLGVDYCEIDNLENNVTIPLNPLLKEIKGLYDAGSVHCRLVLKNVSVEAIDAIRQDVAPTPAAANFIAPFHIFEDDNTSQKASLDAAMKRLKGPGAVTIISTDSNHYGSAFTQDKFLTCK
jgi:uncharacterized protein YraI